MFWGLDREFDLYERPVRLLVRHDRQLYKGLQASEGKDVLAEPAFDAQALDALTGRDGVATPYEISVRAEDVLKQRGQYRPSFYCFMMAVLDANAERRKIAEMNQEKWAMLPASVDYLASDTQMSADAMLGMRLPYRMKRDPYVMGKLFEANLSARWVPVGTVGAYTVYRNTRVESEGAL